MDNRLRTARKAVLLTIAALLAGAAAAGPALASPPSTLTSNACPAPGGNTPVYPAGTRCSTLTVPLDRSNPYSNATAKLDVAVVPPASKTNNDPVLWLQGGPGFDGHSGYADYHRANGYFPGRDIVYIDQRGTGRATPSLDCPNTIPTLVKIFGDNASDQAEQDIWRQNLSQCAAQLGASSYRGANTPATVQDLIDLRKLLKAPQWNVVGFSYGGTVAIDLQRKDPWGTRSTIIDSGVSPTTDNKFSTRGQKITYALNQLFAGCAASTTCTSNYGDLRSLFNQTVADYNANPYEGDVTTDLGPVHVKFTGDDVAYGVYTTFYGTSGIKDLPSYIKALHDRSAATPTIIGGIVNAAGGTASTLAEGALNAVDCADRQRLGADTFSSAVAGQPTYSTIYTTFGTRACDIFQVPSVPASFNTVGRTNVPTLIFSTQYDPIAQRAEESSIQAGLGPAAKLVAVPSMGHGALRNYQDCPRSIGNTFLNAPYANLNTSCTAAMPPVAWSPPLS